MARPAGARRRRLARPRGLALHGRPALPQATSPMPSGGPAAFGRGVAHPAAVAWRVVLKRWVDGLSYDEISHHLQPMSISSVEECRCGSLSSSLSDSSSTFAFSADCGDCAETGVAFQLFLRVLYPSHRMVAAVNTPMLRVGAPQKTQKTAATHDADGRGTSAL